MPKQRSHSAFDFNDDGTRRIPVLLWAVVFYLTRHLLLVLVGIFSVLVGLRKGGTEIGEKISTLELLSSGPLFLVASIPAFLVLVALLQRSTAGNYTRFVLIRGRLLLSGAALVDIALVFYQWQIDGIVLNQIRIFGVLINFYIIWYLWRSRRVQETFSDLATF